MTTTITVRENRKRGATPVPVEPSDAELARLALTESGDRAFAALYRRHVTPLYRYFVVRVGDPALAEDLTASTFVAVLESLPRYRERGSFSGWLFTIAARRLADQRGKRRVLPLELSDVAAADDLKADASAERALDLQRLGPALRSLSPDRAEAVALHFFGELSLAETAQVMGRSRIAVKSLIHRALRDLRARLDHGA